MTVLESSICRSLFPQPVAAAELCGSGEPAALRPAEALHCRHATEKRRRDFAAGRWCARHALSHFGVRDFDLLVAWDRQPVWPERLVGSITHTDGYCAAVVAERSILAGIGLDSERLEPVAAGFGARICIPEETVWIESLPPEQRTAAVLLLFSAKEAFFKSQYPLTRENLGFRDLRVEVVAWQAEEGGSIAGVRGPMTCLIDPTRRLGVARHVALPVEARYRFHAGFVSTGVGLQP